MQERAASPRWALPALVPWLIALLPSVALLALPQPPFDGTVDTYLRYKAIWGGNPNEVFSHFLDLVMISGNVAALGALLVSEAHFRKRVPDHRQLASYSSAVAALCLGVNGFVALWLDNTRGEGTSIVLYPLAVLPVLLVSWRALRWLAERVEWRVPAVAFVAAVFTLAHAVLQYFYEPSHTGAPNALFWPLWVGSLGFLSWTRMRRRRET